MIWNGLKIKETKLRKKVHLHIHLITNPFSTNVPLLYNRFFDIFWGYGSGILVNPFRPNSGRREKIKLHCYFHTSCGSSLKASKAFINLLRHHKEVWRYKFNLIFIPIQLSEMQGTGRVNINNFRLTTNTQQLICQR